MYTNKRKAALVANPYFCRERIVASLLVLIYFLQRNPDGLLENYYTLTVLFILNEEIENDVWKVFLPEIS